MDDKDEKGRDVPSRARRREKLIAYCADCRAKEVETYGTVLNKAGKRHTAACRLAGCGHPPHYLLAGSDVAGTALAAGSTPEESQPATRGRTEARSAIGLGDLPDDRLPIDDWVFESVNGLGVATTIGDLRRRASELYEPWTWARDVIDPVLVASGEDYFILAPDVVVKQVEPEWVLEVTRLAIEQGVADAAEADRRLRERCGRPGSAAPASEPKIRELRQERAAIARGLWNLRRHLERLEEILTAGKGGGGEPVEDAAAPPPEARRD